MTIQEISQELISKLTVDDKDGILLTTFMLLKSNAEKVKFTDQLLQNYNIKAGVPIHLPKRNEKSRELRGEANCFFIEKNYLKALELYNESICLAENGSEELGTSYANRSAIYFHWRKYDLCLKNIKLAKENNYPERLLEKLLKREVECAQKLSENKKIDEVEGADEAVIQPKLSFSPHPEVPFIADCLEMHENNEFGRHIVAKKQLNIGQIIAIDEPFCTLLDPLFRYQRCSNCLTENSMDLIPCKNCTQTMFCSIECSVEAEEKFHKYECPIIDFLNKLVPRMILVEVRIVIQAFTSFETAADLLKCWLDPDSKKANIFTIDFHDNTSSSELFKPINAWKSHQNIRDAEELFEISVYAALLHSAVFKHTTLAKLLETEAEKDLLMELLFRYIECGSINIRSLWTLDAQMFPKLPEIEQYSSGAYGFGSLLNHSCLSNVTRIPIGRRAVVVVVRSIKPGEQIFDGYGVTYTTHSREERYRNLLLYFKFKCKCDACKHDYPKMFEARDAGIPTLLSTQQHQELLQRVITLDKKFAEEWFTRCCIYLTEHADIRPCKQTNFATISMELCSMLLLGETSLKMLENAEKLKLKFR